MYSLYHKLDSGFSCMLQHYQEFQKHFHSITVLLPFMCGNTYNDPMPLIKVWELSKQSHLCHGLLASMINFTEIEQRFFRVPEK